MWLQTVVHAILEDLETPRTLKAKDDVMQMSLQNKSQLRIVLNIVLIYSNLNLDLLLGHVDWGTMVIVALKFLVEEDLN